jgi:hypothetical protein
MNRVFHASALKSPELLNVAVPPVPSPHELASVLPAPANATSMSFALPVVRSPLTGVEAIPCSATALLGSPDALASAPLTAQHISTPLLTLFAAVAEMTSDVKASAACAHHSSVHVVSVDQTWLVCPIRAKDSAAVSPMAGDRVAREAAAVEEKTASRTLRHQRRAYRHTEHGERG